VALGFPRGRSLSFKRAHLILSTAKLEAVALGFPRGRSLSFKLNTEFVPHPESAKFKFKASNMYRASILAGGAACQLKVLLFPQTQNPSEHSV